MRELSHHEIIRVVGGFVPAEEEEVVQVIGRRIAARVGFPGGAMSDYDIAMFLTGEYENARIDLDRCEGPSAGDIGMQVLGGAVGGGMAAARLLLRLGPLVPPHVRAAVVVGGTLAGERQVESPRPHSRRVPAACWAN